MRLQLSARTIAYVEYPKELAEHADAIDALRAAGRVRWKVMDLIGKEVAEQEGISFDWFEVLATIGEHPDEQVRMRDLAQLTLHSKSAMTRLADRIERAGLIRREVCPEDRRAVYATLTDDGRALLYRVMGPIVRILIDRFAEHVTTEEGRYITRVLHRVLLANDVEPDPLTESRIRGAATAGRDGSG